MPLMDGDHDDEDQEQRTVADDVEAKEVVIREHPCRFPAIDMKD